VTALLGLDYGTTSFKVQLFDPAGRALAGGAGELPVRRPAPGWLEQDVSQGWQAVCGEIRQAIEAAGVAPADIVAISATGTYNLSVFDEAGSILRPAMLYGDTRVPSAEQIELILHEIGPRRVAAAFGLAELDEGMLHTILRILRSSKLLWLRAFQPEVYSQIRACSASSMDFINARLTGRMVQLAGAIPLDDDIAALFDIPAAWFGESCHTGQLIGHVVARAAAETGLAEGTPVVMAGVDSHCSFLGAGLAEAGLALNLAGTTDVVAVTAGEQPHPRAGYPLPHLVPGLWLVSLSPLRGPTMRWLRDTILEPGAAFADIDRLAEQAPPGAEGLMCLPYWSGEKGVVHDPQARGILLGLDERHQRGHIARAVLEGIAYGVREILESYQADGLAVAQVRLSGGGARSRLWNQIKADVLGRPAGVLQVLETGCLGAAMLAAITLELYPSRAEASRAMSQIAETLEPDPGRAETYQYAYERYRQLYPANRRLFAELAPLRI
jgi:xylulokinase